MFELEEESSATDHSLHSEEWAENRIRSRSVRSGRRPSRDHVRPGPTYPSLRRTGPASSGSGYSNGHVVIKPGDSRHKGALRLARSVSMSYPVHPRPRLTYDKWSDHRGPPSPSSPPPFSPWERNEHLFGGYRDKDWARGKLVDIHIQKRRLQEEEEDILRSLHREGNPEQAKRDERDRVDRPHRFDRIGYSHRPALEPSRRSEEGYRNSDRRVSMY